MSWLRRAVKNTVPYRWGIWVSFSQIGPALNKIMNPNDPHVSRALAKLKANSPIVIDTDEILALGEAARSFQELRELYAQWFIDKHSLDETVENIIDGVIKLP